TTSNGAISISSKDNTLASTATITGNGISGDHPFTEAVEINDLGPGTYQVCITVDGLPEYQNCVQAVITQPEALIVTSSLDLRNNILTLRMSGGERYNIVHNGRTISTK